MEGSRTRSAMFGGLLAGALAITATAWACTPQNHGMTVSPNVGVNGTEVEVSGVCKVLSPANATHDCTDSGGRELFMDTKTSIEAIQLVEGDHQRLCTVTDQDIGFVSAVDAGTGAFTGEGTISDPPLVGLVPQQSNNRLPGGYIVCAEIAPEKLWDYFNLI